MPSTRGEVESLRFLSLNNFLWIHWSHLMKFSEECTLEGKSRSFSRENCGFLPIILSLEGYYRRSFCSNKGSFSCQYSFCSIEPPFLRVATIRTMVCK